jgi:peptidoglycan/LPS O-acetylase OafA/YrhL
VILLSIIVWAAMLGLVADRELRRLGRTGLSALVLLLAAFFLVYVVTPHNLAWHVSTTLSRLMIQITPLAIFAVLLVTRSVDDMQPPSAVVSTDRTKVPTRKKERT